MHARFPQTTLIFHSQTAGQTGHHHLLRKLPGGRVLGHLLSTSKMALAGQGSKKHNLKWNYFFFSFAALSVLVAMPVPSPHPLTRYAHASPSQLALLKGINRSILFFGKRTATGPGSKKPRLSSL